MKNPTASTGFESANLGTKGQHATSRPPKLKGGKKEYFVFCAFRSHIRKSVPRHLDSGMRKTNDNLVTDYLAVISSERYCVWQLLAEPSFQRHPICK